MKSWTRTLNLDDAHSLLALAQPGLSCEEWSQACQKQMPDLSLARRRELIRLVRDGFLDWTPDDRIAPGLFLEIYAQSPASGQLHLVDVQWAMSHPLTLIAVEHLVAPALERAQRDIPFDTVEAFVSRHVETGSEESRRKTRTVLLGAMEGIGTLVTRGTGQHRSLEAASGRPHPAAYGYLIRRELAERGVDGMMHSEATESSIASRLTQCGPAHAARCVEWNLSRGILAERDDEICLPS